MSTFGDLPGLVRRVREAYDRQHANGERARIKRAATIEEVLSDEAFWQLLYASGVERTLGAREPREREAQRRSIAQAVLVFPAAAHREVEGFSLGRHLRLSLHRDESDDDVVKRALGFRRLLSSRREDPNDVAQKLRRLLRHATTKASSPGESAVDFGRVAVDLALFGTAGGDRVRARWAQDFYADFGQQSQTEGDEAVA